MDKPQPEVGTTRQIAASAQLDEACDRFEAAWKTGHEPKIEDYLLPRADGATQRRLLLELVILDLGYRWQWDSDRDAATIDHAATARGGSNRLSRRPRLEEYIACYPDLGPTAELPALLIVTEFRARLAAGERPRRIDYLARFPEQADAINGLFSQDDEQLRAQSAHEEWQPGARVRYFGDYELLEEIARGGMGVVFKARQRSLGRIVALKMILAGQLAGEGEVKRFHAEAEAAAMLDHPGIVPIYEVGESEGQHFFSMGFVEGESLSKRLLNGPLPPKQAVQLMAAVAEAVAYAHGKGIIHRDLKPANILLDKDGRPRITDFGLAKRISGESGLTASGQVLGTPSYMPSEQASGRLDEVKETADVYALGATLYALLSGRPPFQADNPMDTILQVIRAEPVSLRQLNAKLSRDLETICQKCLEKEPRRRYASATELVDELRRYLEGKPIRARPIGRAARAWRWCKRQPVIATLSFVAIATLIGGGSFSTFFGIQAQHESQVAQENLRQSERSAYNTQLARAAELWHQDPERAEALLTDTQRCPQAMREFTWGLLYGLCDRRRAAWRVGEDPVDCMSYSFDGQLLALVAQGAGIPTRNPDVLVLDTVSGKVCQVFHGHKDSVRSICFSPRDITLATGSSDGTVRLSDTLKGAVRHMLATGKVNKVAFHPRGNLLAVAAEDKPVTVWDVTNGEQLITIPDSQGAVDLGFWLEDIVLTAVGDKTRTWIITKSDLGKYQATLGRVIEGQSWGVLSHGVLSPGGKCLARIDGRGNTELRDLGGEALPYAMLTQRHAPGSTNEGSFWAVRAPCFSTSGDALAVPKSDDRTAILDINTAQERLVLPVPIGGRQPSGRNPCRSMAYSPDGHTLAIGTAAGTIETFSAQPGYEQRVVQHESEWLTPVAHSPTSTRLATADHGQITISDYQVQDTRRENNFINLPCGGDRSPVTSLAFSPDGKRLASAGYDRKVRLWKMDAVTEVIPSIEQVLLAECTGHTDTVWAVAISPDGRFMASASADKNVRLWDAVSGKAQGALTGHEAGVRTIAFHPSAGVLASADDNGFVRLWQIATKRELAHWRAEMRGARVIAFSPDGKYLVTAGDAGTIAVWNWKSAQRVRVLDGHTGAVYCLAFLRDGKSLVSGGKDCMLKQWNVATGQLIGEEFQWSPVTSLAPACQKDELAWALGNCEHGTRTKLDLPRPTNPLSREVTGNEAAQWMGFSRDGQTLAVGNADTTIELWDVDTGKSKAVLRGHNAPVLSAEFSPDGELLASLGRDGNLIAWDIGKGLPLRRLDADPASSNGSRECHQAVAFSPEGLVELLTTRMQKIGVTSVYWVSNWDPVSGAMQATGEHSISFEPNPDTVRFSHDGRVVHFFGEQGVGFTESVGRADLSKATVTQASLACGRAVRIRSFSGDGELCAVVELESTDSITIYDTRTGQQLHRLVGDAGDIQAVDFTPDNRTIAMGHVTGELALWDVLTGQRRITLPSSGTPVSRLRFSPTGTALACVGKDNRIRLFRTRNDRLLATFPTGVPRAAQLSSDNSTLATLDKNGKLALRELPSGHTRWEKALCDRSDPLQGEWVLRFSADGGRLVACGRDQCEISDTKSGRRQSAFDGKTAMSPDGVKLALAKSDSLSIYDVTTGRLEATHVLGEEFKETAVITYSSPSKRFTPYIQFSPGGTEVLVIGQRRDKLQFMAVDARTGACGTPLPCTLDEYYLALDNHVAAQLSANYVQELRWLDTGSGKCVKTLALSKQLGLHALSPDGRVLAIANPSGQYYQRGENLVQAHDSVLNGTLSHSMRSDPSSITMLDPGTVTLIDTVACQIKRELPNSTGTITAVAFSKDGGLLSVASSDHSVTLWDLHNSVPLARLIGHLGTITAMDFASDGKFLATASEDGTVKLWSTDSFQNAD